MKFQTQPTVESFVDNGGANWDPFDLLQPPFDISLEHYQALDARCKPALGAVRSESLGAPGQTPADMCNHQACCRDLEGRQEPANLVSRVPRFCRFGLVLSESNDVRNTQHDQPNNHRCSGVGDSRFGLCIRRRQQAGLRCSSDGGQRGDNTPMATSQHAPRRVLSLSRRMPTRTGMGSHSRGRRHDIHRSRLHQSREPETVENARIECERAIDPSYLEDPPPLNDEQLHSMYENDTSPKQPAWKNAATPISTSPHSSGTPPTSKLLRPSFIARRTRHIPHRPRHQGMP